MYILHTDLFWIMNHFPLIIAIFKLASNVPNNVDVNVEYGIV